ncbi:MAG: hypothetical protein JWR61_2459 [Ferruginibacter sp.]|uniref:hypothetical protein n=1 Tax=Ferruginibacter sp. TaxID=1940288 RepID=UPI00265A6686|nr:hypothetical protein [Ferruginibacter sp.]MDB5277504.1 hypothetical protein [Ferruginibacter sp.]
MKAGKNFSGWRIKLEKAIAPKIVEVPEKWASKIGHGKMLVPTPMLVDGVIKKIPKGQLATVNTIRSFLAQKFNTDLTCPLTTGIFLNIAAHAAEEDKMKGEKKITPYWRVLREGGFLNPKFPGGAIMQSIYLKREGFEVLQGKGKDLFFVKDYDKKLAVLNPYSKGTTLKKRVIAKTSMI